MNTPQEQRQGWGDTMLKLMTRLRTDDQGATAVEYGLIVSLIFLAAAGAMEAFGSSAMEMWDFIATNVLNN